MGGEHLGRSLLRSISVCNVSFIFLLKLYYTNNIDTIIFVYITFKIRMEKLYVAGDLCKFRTMNVTFISSGQVKIQLLLSCAFEFCYCRGQKCIDQTNPTPNSTLVCLKLAKATQGIEEVLLLHRFKLSMYCWY